MIRAALPLGLLVLASAAGAQAPSQPPQDRILLLADHHRLDRGLADWNEAGVQLSRHWSVREVAEIGLLRTRRFGQDDTQLQAGYSAALGPRLTGAVQGNASPSHHVLARYALGGNLQYEFADRWLAHAGARHTRYDNARVNQLRLALEHYTGPFSVLAAWSPARALGQGADTVELRGHWYYGEDSSVGVIASRGDEATQLGAGRVVLADVRSLALTGRHGLAPGRWLVWGVNRTRQGDFYTRSGATLGLQLAF
ncbi:YaiO family outer membrane beta-barrel protein [Ramlibacter sp. Leaf400]|uniref:YaiO family outer membrane beta-barrel protein n=1 Tax=Ramlibacter sp. Leaf400 TaxID=1736365 RepID=UPI0006F90949|nr:YaiO family outer membrane beta-barrel protein [Ramlibacter sp. Leaf400]KQT07684.1 hypothetical protein ASG30_17820 [Ramlibacter sp. Leaf400]